MSAPSNVSLTGDATSATGARLFPGDVSGSTGAGGLTTSIGTLTIHGNLSFDSLSSLNIDLNHSAADKVIDDGTITLGGAGLNFSLGTPDLDGTESFTLIDNQGVGSIVGEFGKINGVAGTYSEGSTITVGTQSYKLTYAGGIGNNDVMLLPVALPGDFNGDSKINAADYVTWRKNDGTASGYAAWRENFSQSSAAAPSFAEAAAVPEPATLAGVILVSPFIAAGLARRKSGRSRKC